MLEINLLEAMRETEKKELARLMKNEFTKLDYFVETEASDYIRMRKISRQYALEGIIELGKKGSDIYFAWRIVDNENNPVVCRECNGEEEALPVSWQIKNPDYSDLRRFVFAEMENFLSGPPSTIKPVRALCAEYKRPKRGKLSFGQRIERDIKGIIRQNNNPQG